MVKFSFNPRLLLLPAVSVIILEVLWNILGGFIDPWILNVPLHIVKYILYGLAGFIGARFSDSDTIGSSLYGLITGGIGAVVEGFIISLIFFGYFFYAPGFAVGYAVSHIFSLMITGGIFGLIGAFLADREELDPVEEVIKNIMN